MTADHRGCGCYLIARFLNVKISVMKNSTLDELMVLKRFVWD